MPPKSSTMATGIDRFLDCELAGEIEFLAARTRSLGSARANVLLAPLGLKVRSYSVLSLACSGMSPTQRELAEFLSLDPSQIVPLVDQLEKGGFVERHADPNDRRSKVISATPEGHKLYKKARLETARGEAMAMERLSKEEQDTLRDMLARIAFVD